MKLPWKKERNKKLISSIMAMTFALSTGFPYMNDLSSVIGEKTAHASSMSDILMYQAMAGSSSDSSSANMSMMMALSGGFKISSKVKYVYYVPSDLENVTITCTAGTTKSKKPVVGDEVSYQCMGGSNGTSKFSPPVVSKSMTIEEAGTTTMDLIIKASKREDVKNDTGTVTKTQDVWQDIPIQIIINASETVTSITNGSSNDYVDSYDPTTISGDGWDGTATGDTIDDTGLSNDGSYINGNGDSTDINTGINSGTDGSGDSTNINNGTGTSSLEDQLCEDGSYFCANGGNGGSNGGTGDPTDINGGNGGINGGTGDPTDINGGINGGTGDPTDINGRNGENGINGTDGTNGTNGTNGLNTELTPISSTDPSSLLPSTSYIDPTTGLSGRDYRDIIDSLLGDDSGDSSYNSGNDDWGLSNGGDGGAENLDNYFDETANEGILGPDGMTDDSMGVGDLIGNDGGGYADSGWDNGSGNGDGSLADGNWDYQGGNTYYVDDGSGNDGDGNGNLGFAGDNLEDMYKEGLAGLDSMTGDGAGLLGAITPNSTSGSLAQKLKELVGDNSITNNKRGTATDQELFDFAKKLLGNSGFTLDDIRSGRNYDPNSAYTEPSTAWDMNRITTLLRGRRIKLSSPSEAKNANNANKNASANKNNNNNTKTNTNGNSSAQTKTTTK